MSAIKFFKVESKPNENEIEPNSVYLVNDSGDNVKIYFSDNTGTHLFPLYNPRYPENSPKYTGIGIPNVTRKATPKVVGDIIGAPLSTMGLVNGRLYMIPYLTTRPLILTSLRLGVSSGRAGMTVSIGIYDNIILSNGDDNPHMLLAAVHNLPTHLTGNISGAISFTFSPNTLYWIGIISTGAPFLRAVTDSSLASSLGRIQNNNNAVTHLYKDYPPPTLPPYEDYPLPTLPNIAPTDLLADTGSFPAVYLVE